MPQEHTYSGCFVAFSRPTPTWKGRLGKVSERRDKAHVRWAYVRACALHACLCLCAQVRVQCSLIRILIERINANMCENRFTCPAMATKNSTSSKESPVYLIIKGRVSIASTSLTAICLPSELKPHNCKTPIAGLLARAWEVMELVQPLSRFLAPSCEMELSVSSSSVLLLISARLSWYSVLTTSGLMRESLQASQKADRKQHHCSNI